MRLGLGRTMGNGQGAMGRGWGSQAAQAGSRPGKTPPGLSSDLALGWGWGGGASGQDSLATLTLR